MSNYTYILKCADGTLYCGWTNDLDKRLAAHNAGTGAKYTRTRRPVELIYHEIFATKQEAMSREAHIKKMTRQEKLNLIHNQEGGIIMNEIIKAMKERRSIRKFKPEMPSKADIEQIIEVGLYAANGRGKQAVITVAVTQKELRDKIAADNCAIGGWNADFDPFYGAPVILMVLAQKDWPTCVYDGSLVMGNMMLAAHSLGLGSIWIHRAKEEAGREDYKELLKTLGIEGEWEGIGHCAVGYVDGDYPSAPPRKDNRVFWVE